MPLFPSLSSPPKTTSFILFYFVVFSYFCSMLKFDERGNLKPYGIVQSSLEEMKDYFVNNIESETRKANFEKYLQYFLQT